MVDVLAQIVAHKRTQVAMAMEAIPLAQLQSLAEQAAPARDFFGSLTQPPGQLRVIAEVKKASPSAGLIRADFDPVAIASAYHRHGAAAISCLTDERFFQGSMDYLIAIRQAVPLPVLRKDFLLEPYQVYQARAAGADAILLIAECLPTEPLERLLNLATQLGMSTLVEVHDRENLLRVKPLLNHRSLLGINNRDLRTMTTNLDHTLRLLDAVPDRSLVVSESGIKTPQDIARLQQAGVHRILVGEHLMRQPDVGIALSQLISHPPSPPTAKGSGGRTSGGRTSGGRGAEPPTSQPTS